MTAWVGRRLPRFEDPPLLRGEGRFAADLAGGSLHLRFVRSPLPHGRIVSVDAPGHVTMFTADDLAGVGPLRPLLHREDYRPVEQPILARDTVRFAGEPMAAVLAGTSEEAEDAAEQVFADIEPLDHVTDAAAAVRPGAPAVHEHVPGNTVVDARYQTDGVDEAFAAAAAVVEFDLRSRRQSAMPLEARGSVASYDRRSGRTTLFASVQSPHVVRTVIADLIGMPEAVDLPAFRERQAGARAQGRCLGVGFSVFSERTGYGTSAFAARSMDVTPGYETVDLVMDPSGAVEARLGASPHGQGLETSLAQLIGDELGVDPASVRIVHGDTDRTPYGWGTFASRSLVISGGAVKLAAGRLRAKLAAVAAAELEAAPEDIVISGGRAAVKGAGAAAGVDVADLARIAYHASHRLEAGMSPGLAETATYDPAGTFSNACHAAVVEVDRETGGVRIERFVVVEDAGVLINPMIVDGQLHGGVAQGIAGALYEEIVYDEDGNILTGSLLDYLPPTMAETPEIEIHHLVTVSDATLTGAKGLGEGGTIGAPAAVINAVSDALRPLGVEVNETPATPSRLRRLIRQSERIPA